MSSSRAKGLMYWCKDYCHRVTTHLKVVVVVVVVRIIIIFSSYIPSAACLVCELCVIRYKIFIYYFCQMHRF